MGFTFAQRVQSLQLSRKGIRPPDLNELSALVDTLEQRQAILKASGVVNTRIDVGYHYIDKSKLTNRFGNVSETRTHLE